MSFEPKTEEDLQNAMVWPNDNYDFEVVSSEQKTSKTSGNNMLEVKLKVFHSDGGSQIITDYLVESDMPLCLMKLRHYCASVGNIEAYESGELGNFPGVGSSGVCRLKIEHSDTWGDQNKVSDYIVPEELRPIKNDPPLQGAVPAQVKRAKVALGEDIPF